MTDQTKISELQEAISLAQSKKARAVVERENAETSLREAKERLTNEFNVSSPKEITALIEELEKQIEDEVATIEENLAKAEE